MYLKRLHLHGFKSFATRTGLEFSPGITTIVGPNGSGKCLDGNSLVTLANGRDVPIRKLVDDAMADSRSVETLDDGQVTRENPHNIHILSLNPDTFKLEPRPVTAFVKREAPSHLLRIRTRAGRTIIATPYHPLFTLDRGRLHALKAEELQLGLRIALPRRLPLKGNTIPLKLTDSFRRFNEEDKVYVPTSPQLHAWADSERLFFGGWEQWRKAANVTPVQMDGFLSGQSMNVAALMKLVDVATTSAPLNGQLKSHGTITMRVPTEFTPDLARFLGLMVSEGRTSVEGNPWFVNADPQVNEDFAQLAQSLFNVQVFRQRYKPNAEDSIIFSRTLGLVLDKLFQFPVNAKSAEKCIPTQVFQSDHDVQWAFLSGVFEGDAHVHLKKSKERHDKPQVYIEYTSASATLAHQVVALLLRLGIFASIKPKEKYATNTLEKRVRTYYSVFIYGANQLRYVAEHLRFVGYKEAALQVLRNLIPMSNPNHDLVPGVTPLVKEAARLAGVSVKSHRKESAKLAAYVEQRCESSRGGLLECIRMIETYGEISEHAREHLDVLTALAHSDVYWDEIVGIEEVAPAEPWVYDLCVAETHNFVADGIIAHNSNIADSLRWVLGEQNMRQLRGKKSEDIIFAGGHSRGALGMAEVTLTLDNSSNWLPSDYSEVTVTRRAFRSGESDYLINGTKVRLKDILTLLSQARIGHDSYTIIGQGLVDQALSARAEERRGLFEDAAGIRHFQGQRNDAEQRLHLTQNNLSRLHDILSEIEPRLGPLAEQARRASEYITTRAELDRGLRRWYGLQWAAAQVALERSEGTEQQSGARVEHLRATLGGQETEQTDLRERRAVLLKAIGDLRRQRGEAMAHIQGLERDLAVARERGASVARARGDLAGEQATVRQSAADMEARVTAMIASFADTEEAIDFAAASMAELESTIHRARQQQDREEARVRAAQRDVMQAQAQVTATQTELARLHKQRDEREAALITHRQQLAQMLSRAEEAQARLDNLRVAHEAQRAELGDKLVARETGTQAISDAQTAAEASRAGLADMQRERRALLDRLTLLQEWSAANGDPTALLAAIAALDEEERPHVLGTLAQLVRVPPIFDTAVEAALGPYLHAVVALSEDDAWRCAEIACAEAVGRVVVLWPVEQRDDATRHEHELATQVAQQSPDAVATIVSHLLKGMLVLDQAPENLRWQLDGKPVVTLAGAMAHPAGWLAVGQPAQVEAGASVLARARELRDLPELVDACDEHIQSLEMQLADARALVEQVKQAQQALERDIKAREARLSDGAKLVGQMQRETEKITNEAQISGAVEQRLATELLSLEHDVAAAAERLTQAEALFADRNAVLEAVQFDAEAVVQEARSQHDDLEKRRTALAVQRQEQKSLQQRIEATRGQARELAMQMERRDERLQELDRQSVDVAAAIARYGAELAEQRDIAHAIQTQLQAQEADNAAIDRRVAELEKAQAAERVELTQAENDYRRALLDAQRARDAIVSLTAQMMEEMGEDDTRRIRERPDDEAAEPALPPDEMAKMRRQIDSLRGRLKSLGGYDPEAPQAYEELKTRYEFLTAQVRDMEEASARLRAVIIELDTTMRRKFEETFHAVNERFGQHFTTLFHGGAARLELTAPKRAPKESSEDGDEDEIPEPMVTKRGMTGGVEVYVQIPGKKVQDLSLLSGGERAMVSAALLFALLETNPPPFCLLDEVDAALDESNVVRFCEILEQIANQTQFIVITHNRVTMTHANAIYGVSMTDSVSRILSMRLAEAQSA